MFVDYDRYTFCFYLIKIITQQNIISSNLNNSQQERKKRVASQASNHYATVISSCWKGYLARVETKHRHTILDSLQNDRVAEINAAAVKLQASTRGYLTRKDQKRKEAEILRENEIKKHLPKALREEQLTVDQDMIHSDYNNIKIISPKRNILSKEEMLGSLFETNRGGLSFVIESSLTRVPLLSELSEVFNLPPPPPPSVEFKTLTGSAVTFKIEDNLPVVYVDSLFSHYATKVIYDASTRYITLERTIPCGEDTVQICGTSLPTILTGIIDVCEASDLKHNLCGQSQILEEQSVHVLQRATRRFKAKQLVCIVLCCVVLCCVVLCCVVLCCVVLCCVVLCCVVLCCVVLCCVVLCCVVLCCVVLCCVVLCCVVLCCVVLCCVVLCCVVLCCVVLCCVVLCCVVLCCVTIYQTVDLHHVM